MQGDGRPRRAARRRRPRAGRGLRPLSRELVYPLRVRYAECDPQGVVFNSRYLEYFDVALTELWREALGPYEQVMEEHGVDLLVAEAGIRYRRPLRFDEEFELRASVRRLGTTSTTIAIAVLCGHELVAEGELRHVFVRRGGAEKTAIPERMRVALDPYLHADPQLSA